MTAASGAADEPPLVLAVDDDEGVLRLLDVKLTRAGYRVITSSDGREALAIALARGPAAVIIEQDLPSLGGLALCRKLVGAGQRRPVVLFLSYVDRADDLERAFRSGCDDFVAKPFSPQDLLHRLEIALLRRRLEEEGAESILLRSALS